MNVINADKFNPHCSFNFNFNPQNINEYRKLLLNLDKRPSRLKFKNDIYKFYYMHHFYLKDFNLFFKSKFDCDAFNKSKNYSEIISIYLNNIYSNKEKILDKVEKFLLSKNKYLLSDKKLEFLKQFDV